MTFRRTAVTLNRPVRSKRQTDWQLSFQSVDTAAIAAGAKVVLASINTFTRAPFTIIRIRGVLKIITDQNVANEEQIGAFGVGLVNIVASNLGTTGVPGPFTDILWDGWMLHQSFVQRNEFSTAAGFESTSGVNYELDSKAMRKVEVSQGLEVVVENGGPNGFLVMMALRILAKAG